MLGKTEGRRRRGQQYEMAGWHHQPDEYECINISVKASHLACAWAQETTLHQHLAVFWSCRFLTYILQEYQDCPILLTLPPANEQESHSLPEFPPESLMSAFFSRILE